MNLFRGIILVLLCASVLPASEFTKTDLVAVEASSPRTVRLLLDEGIMVVRDMELYLLVLADKSDFATLDRLAVSWELLDSGGPASPDYYTVEKRGPRNFDALRMIEGVRVLRVDDFSAVIAASFEGADKVSGAKFDLAMVFRRTIRLASPEKPAYMTKTAVYDAAVQGMVDAVSIARVTSNVQRLQNFQTRYSTHDSCQAAANWIKAEYESYGIDSVYFHNFSGTYKDNVVAVIPGVGNPDKVVLVGGHYDSTTPDHNNAPGADDDASGTSCAMECARVLSNYQFNYTLMFAAFGAEEQGLIGSEALASDLAASGVNIVAAVCVDMIGYVAGGDAVDLDIIDNAGSQWLRDLAVESAGLYLPGFSVVDGNLPGGAGSDHSSFWANGYNAILFFEDTGNYSPFIHTGSDVVGTSYNSEILSGNSVKTAVALLATMAEPFRVAVNHTPLENTTNTSTPYTVTADILAADALNPDSLLVRYDDGSGMATLTMAATATPSEYEAAIPAQAGGTWVDYYIVAEDVNGNRASDPGGAPLAPHSFFVGTITAVYEDDLEAAGTWSVGDAGDNATTGVWTRLDPNGTWSGSIPVQPENDHTAAPGVNCFVTGNTSPGGGQGDNDVDGGKTTLFSPIYDLSGVPNARVRYFKWYCNDTGSSPGADVWQVHVSDDAGGSWAMIESTTTSNHSWNMVETDLEGIISLTSQVKFRFIAADEGSGSIVEAGVDDFSIVTYEEVTTEIAGSTPAAPALYLGANRPNPFNPTTEIFFGAPLDGRKVSLGIYDLSGRLVTMLLKDQKVAGAQSVTWDGTNGAGNPVVSGIYFSRLIAGEWNMARKLVLVR